jgi:hypothetical protein
MQDSNAITDDEIDLKELFLALWRGKLTIVFICAIALFGGAVYLHKAERTFSVKAVYKPVAEDTQAPNLGGFGGLASLAGITLPSSSGSDFTAFQALLTSQEVADILMNEQDVLSSLFKLEWDAENETFSQPVKSARGRFIGVLKKTLTGSEQSDYIAPNSQRLSEELTELMTVSVDKNTGYLAVSSEATDPQIRINLIQKMASITDDLLKQRYIENAEDTLAFYHKKMTLARSREQREALAKLMAQEDQRLMLAARGKNFVVEPLMRPTASLYPTSPKASLILALSIVLGGFLGSALVLIRASLQTRGDKPNA